MSRFICPICSHKLNKQEKSYVCENGHAFDIARQGYVNLLPANKKHSDNPGDSREMVLSRRSFLENGFYDCFSDKLNSLVKELFDDRQNLTILDCGCGEGFYDGKLTESLGDCELYGFDISKEAVRAAAAKYKNCSFAVASCFNMPVADDSFDLAINVFAPMVEAELLRILKAGGYLIYAVPGKEHLMGLKKVLYENTYENTEKDTEYNGFRFIGRYPVKDNIAVSGEDLVNLFKMTPYYYKSEKNSAEKLLSAGTVNTDIHFDFLVYKKL